jgi:hypothetical protein
MNCSFVICFRFSFAAKRNSGTLTGKLDSIFLTSLDAEVYSEDTWLRRVWKSKKRCRKTIF